ncbi:DUF883 family protein [Undibacterium sp. Jales W-56]|uniref:DUF883 family protein n=1 Tax=Undibacterium sp. Jales W-56 TaxID=2897325 RepID=UPI0021D10226|nr:DUF883 family protein [Undibacterium sp. Jales W-56]MCU6433860.1 DUF883 family protein [Undibacterium sp. Jales W-56]
MLESNLKAVNTDVKVLLKDSQALFVAAAALTGEKAEEARARAMQMLDAALVKAQEAQANAIIKGKELATSADVYVKENPWCAIATAAGVGLLLGMVVRRK